MKLYLCVCVCVYLCLCVSVCNCLSMSEGEMVIKRERKIKRKGEMKKATIWSNLCLSLHWVWLMFEKKAAALFRFLICCNPVLWINVNEEVKVLKRPQ